MGIAALAAFAMIGAVACSSDTDEEPAATSAPAGSDAAQLPSSAMDIATERGFTTDNITAALKAYVPTGEHDEDLLFASGGHSGQLLVYGIPSMRLLKAVAVFTPEPWQGWAVGSAETEAILDGGNLDSGKDITYITRRLARPRATTTVSSSSLTKKLTAVLPLSTFVTLRRSRSSRTRFR
jgi:nitrous-oxide reductase